MKPGIHRLGLIVISTLALLPGQNSYASRSQEGERLSFFEGTSAAREVRTQTDDRLTNNTEMLLCVKDAISKISGDDRKLEAVDKIKLVRVVKAPGTATKTLRSVRRFFTFGIWKGGPADVGGTLSADGTLTMQAFNETECDTGMMYDLAEKLLAAPRAKKRRTGELMDSSGSNSVHNGFSKDGLSERRIAVAQGSVDDLSHEVALGEAQRKVQAAEFGESRAQQTLDRMGDYAQPVDQENADRAHQNAEQARTDFALTQQNYHLKRLDTARNKMRAATDETSFASAKQLADDSSAALAQLGGPDTQAVSPQRNLAQATQPVPAQTQSGGPVRKPAPVAPRTQTNTPPAAALAPEVTAFKESYPEEEQKNDVIQKAAAEANLKAADVIKKAKLSEIHLLEGSSEYQNKLSADGHWNNATPEQQKRHKILTIRAMYAIHASLNDASIVAVRNKKIAESTRDAALAGKIALLKATNGTEKTEEELTAFVKADSTAEYGIQKEEAELTKATAKVTAANAAYVEQRKALSKQLTEWAELETHFKMGDLPKTGYSKVEIPGKPVERDWSVTDFMSMRGFIWSEADGIWVEDSSKPRDI